MVVEGWLERAAATAPQRAAVETPHGSLSYAQLLALARTGAGELTERGVAPGARVAIALPPGLAFAQALHACLLVGAVAVPVDLRLSSAERSHLAAGAAVVLKEPLGSGERLGGGAVMGASLDVAAPPRQPARGALAGAAERSDPPLGRGHELAATAVVIHTSGTTSAPRPVELTYGNFLWSALGSAVALGLDPRERWLCALPLSHVGGLSILMRSAIYATTAVVHERFQTERVLQALREQNVTLVSLVATTLARLLDAGLERPPTLRCALTGGGPVPPALLDRARAAGVPVSQTYGLTESCSQATTTPLAAIGGGPAPTAGGSQRGWAGAGSADTGWADAGRTDAGWAGTPIFCTRLRIAPDGEIMVAGPTVAPGSLDEEGWLHTGDLGSLDGDGRLCVTGRASETIVSGGENVAPTEVEAVLESHPGVLEAAVLGRPDPDWGEAVTAIVVARPGVALAQESLRAHCAANLAPYKVPKRIVLAEEALPRTRSGKLLRRELV